MTIKLPFFYETRVLFVLRKKNMSACDFQSSKKRTGNYVRAAAEEASPAAADPPKRKPKRAGPGPGTGSTGSVSTQRILLACQGTFFLLLFILFFLFCCFFLPHYFNFPSPSLTSHRALSSHEQLNYFCTWNQRGVGRCPLVEHHPTITIIIIIAIAIIVPLIIAMVPQREKNALEKFVAKVVRRDCEQPFFFHFSAFFMLSIIIFLFFFARCCYKFLDGLIGMSDKVKWISA